MYFYSTIKNLSYEIPAALFLLHCLFNFLLIFRMHLNQGFLTAGAN